MSSVGGVAAVALLGVLAATGPRHGHDIRRIIAAWRLDWWADLQPGSVYSGLARLASRGLVREVRVERDGKRPQRRVFEITESGRAELQHLLHVCLIDVRRTARPADIALQMNGLVDQSDMRQWLHERVKALEASSAYWETATLRELEPGYEPALWEMVLDLFDHERRLVRAELDWSRHVLERLNAGAYERKFDGRRAALRAEE